MVDLHDSLRPTGTAPPLPVSEIANRGKRRKRRRLASTTGLAVATMGIAAFLISTAPWAPTDTMTVADGTHADSTTSIEVPATSSEPQTSTVDEATPVEDTELTTPSSITSSSSSSSTSADNAADSSTSTNTSAETGPMTTPGIQISTTRTSEWEDGYCIQVEVSNDQVDRTAWQVVLDLDGTIATLWNATVVEASTGVFVFSGEQDYNESMQPGAVTSFGTCVDTNAG